MEKVKGIADKAKGGWDKLDSKKKTTMVILVVGIILVAILATYYSNKIEYRALFTNLELDDSGRIASDLESKSIKYKLENNGRDILVDEDILDEYRIQLAMEGMMPQNSTGFEIFDEMGLMVTDEDRKIMYERALTGELQRSIMSLEAINNAKVHLTIPEKTIFDDQVGTPSASIVLDVKEYESINENMIVGIASLVSGAVDNMEMENIRIIDSRGNLLSASLQDNGEMNSFNIVNQHTGLKESFESKIESKVMDLLGSAYGWDNVRVSVYADLDFDAEESTVITYSDPVTRSEQIEASGGNIDVQQVTGGNLDDNISNVIESDDGDTSYLNRTINNELSTETTNTIKAPGKVEKLSTSVIYDGNLSNADIARIENIVAAATGYDGQRGDIVNVESIVFDRPDQEVIDDGTDIGSGISGFVKDNRTWILRIAGILAIIILLVLIIRNQIKKRREEMEFEKQLEMEAAAASAPTIGQAVETIEERLEVKSDPKEKSAQNYAKENPDLAADLIKAWLKD